MDRKEVYFGSCGAITVSQPVDWAGGVGAEFLGYQLSHLVVDQDEQERSLFSGTCFGCSSDSGESALCKLSIAELLKQKKIKFELLQP